jgi:hypothetical protein
MADLFARHPNTVKDSIEMNGVQGKLTVREQCSILHMGEKCNEACRSNPEILQAVHQKMEEFKNESAREIPIISTP